MTPSASEPFAGPYETGMWARIRCRGARLWLSALRLVFGFDAWHAAAPYACRPYKRAVVELANALRPDVAVEVGCGLGDIISRVGAAETIGVDTDLRVIRAARFLHPHGHWIHGDASQTRDLLPGPRRIDCLIMVNWIHSLSPEELAGLVLPLLASTRYLIVDGLDAEGTPSYRYKHDFAFLAGRVRQASVVRVPGEGRTFRVFETLP